MTDPHRKLRVGEKAPWAKGRRRNKPIPRKLLQQLRAKIEDTSQRELAGYLGVHGKTLWNWLNGKKNPSQETVDKMRQWVEDAIRKKAFKEWQKNNG